MQGLLRNAEKTQIINPPLQALSVAIRKADGQIRGLIQRPAGNARIVLFIMIVNIFTHNVQQLLKTE